MEPNLHQNKNHSTSKFTPLFHFFKWIIAIALVVVINLLFQYGVIAVAPAPTIDQFCPAQPVNYTDAVSCVQKGGQWTNYPLTPVEITQAVQNNQPLGTCNPTFTCNNNYIHAHSVYNKDVFIALIALSLISIALGLFIHIESLSLGFSLAGIVSLVIASFEYWPDADNWMRALVLIVAVIMLVWVSVKEFRSARKNRELKK